MKIFCFESSGNSRTEYIISVDQILTIEFSLEIPLLAISLNNGYYFFINTNDVGNGKTSIDTGYVKLKEFLQNNESYLSHKFDAKVNIELSKTSNK